MHAMKGKYCTRIPSVATLFSSIESPSYGLSWRAVMVVALMH